MTADQLKREQSYRVAMALAKCMLNDDIIDDAEYREIDALMMDRFRPILAGIYP